MSLCNRVLSGVWCCHWRRPCLLHLCTAVLVTALIIETSYPANICINTPSICTWNIMSMWCIFLNGSHFSKFLYLALLSTWLSLESSYLPQLSTYTGATHRGWIVHLSIILLKLWIFKKIHILHFLAYLATMPKILKFINDTPHTQKYRYTQTHAHTDTDSIFAFYTFCLIWHTYQRY